LAGLTAVVGSAPWEVCCSLSPGCTERSGPSDTIHCSVVVAACSIVRPLLLSSARRGGVLFCTASAEVGLAVSPMRAHRHTLAMSARVIQSSGVECCQRLPRLLQGADGFRQRPHSAAKWHCGALTMANLGGPLRFVEARLHGNSKSIGICARLSGLLARGRTERRTSVPMVVFCDHGAPDLRGWNRCGGLQHRQELELRGVTSKRGCTTLF